MRVVATAILDDHGQDLRLVVLGDLNDTEQAATTQLLYGPPGSQDGTGGFSRPVLVWLKRSVTLSASVSRVGQSGSGNSFSAPEDGLRLTMVICGGSASIDRRKSAGHVRPEQHDPEVLGDVPGAHGDFDGGRALAGTARVDGWRRRRPADFAPAPTATVPSTRAATAGCATRPADMNFTGIISRLGRHRGMMAGGMYLSFAMLLLGTTP